MHKTITKKRNFLFLLTTLLAQQAQADFNFGGCQGSGTFEQQIHKYQNYEDAATIGEIPEGIKGLKVSLISDKDVDIRLYGDNNDKIVHWPYGILKKGTLETKPYQGANVTYSGYNGVGGEKGHEYIEVSGTTPTTLTMKAFGYRAGYATVNYSWTGKEGCVPKTSGEGNFTQALEQNSTSLVGTIPPHVNDVQIELKSIKDLDIQLYAEDGTAIASWKPTGLMSKGYKQSMMYHDMNITWSGYNGTHGQKGNEYITITGETSEMLVMKVFGYESGEADVTYSWGDVAELTVSNVHASNIEKNSAKILWDLNDYATGQVEYGETTAYGQLSKKETSYKYKSHGQLLKNLQQGTTYHYRVISEDKNGQKIVSDDYTFTTLSDNGYADLGQYTPKFYTNNKQKDNKYIAYYPENGISVDMPVVMFIKGGGSSTIDGYSGIMKFLASKGYYVMGVDANSYSSSYVTSKLELALNDVKARHGLNVSKLVIMGHSLGGGQVFYAMKKFRDDGYGDAGNLALSIDGWFSFDMNTVDLNQLDSNIAFVQMNGVHGTGTDPRIDLKIWNLSTLADKSFYTLPANAHSYVAGDLANILQKDDLRLMIGALTHDAFNNSKEGADTIPQSNKASYDDIFNALQDKNTYKGGDCAGINYNGINVIKNFDIDYCSFGQVVKKYPQTTQLTKRDTDESMVKPTVNHPTDDNVYNTRISMVHKSDNSYSPYPKVQAWNSNMTLMRIGSRLYNANTLEETDITKTENDVASAYYKLCARSSDYFRWSNKNANTFYVINSHHKFIEGKINANNVDCSHVLEPFDGYEVVHMGPHEGNIDNNDKYVVFLAKKPNDTAMYVILYDIQNTAVVWTKTMAGQAWKKVNGSWDTGTLDWISVSQSGKYIVYNNRNGNKDGMYRYDINFENKVKLQYEYHGQLYSEGGHGDLGYDTEGHEVFVQFIAGMGVYSFNLDNPHESGIELLHSPYGGGHVSCRNTNRPGWCYITANVDSNGNGLKDVFALKIDGTGDENVEEFSQTHINDSFEITYGGASPDGTKVIFNSRWGTNSIDTFVTEAK